MTRRCVRAAMRNASIALFGVLPIVLGAQARQQTQERVIEVIAGHDSRYKIPGQNKPVITVQAGEAVHLKITAIKAKNRNRDGSVHGFELLGPDHKRVPGWDLLLKPGVQEFDLKAPEQPGEYLVVCTVICSSRHEQMTMKFIVEPNAK